jgi:hypothetical protein
LPQIPGIRGRFHRENKKKLSLLLNFHIRDPCLANVVYYIMDILANRIEYLEYILESSNAGETSIPTKGTEFNSQVQELHDAIDQLVRVDSLRALISNLDVNNLWTELDLWKVEDTNDAKTAVSDESMIVNGCIEQRRSIVSSHIEEFQAITASLDKLSNAEIPPSKNFSYLAALKPHLEDMRLRLDTPVREWEELSIRNAQALRVLLEDNVIRENEQWLEIEDRIRNIEKVIRGREASDKSKKSYE